MYKLDRSTVAEMKRCQQIHQCTASHLWYTQTLLGAICSRQSDKGAMYKLHMWRLPTIKKESNINQYQILTELNEQYLCSYGAM